MASPSPQKGSKRDRSKDLLKVMKQKLFSRKQDVTSTSQSSSSDDPGPITLNETAEDRSRNGALSTPLPSSAGPTIISGLNTTDKVNHVVVKSTEPLLRHNTSGKLKKAWNVTWNGLETALRLLEKSADTFPPLQSAVGVLIACLDVIQAVAQNREDYDELAAELTNIANLLTKYAPRLIRNDVGGSVARIVESIKDEVTYISQQRDRSIIIRTIEANQDQGDVLKRYHRIESLFRQLQSDISLRTWEDTQKLHEMTLLGHLSPVDDARYNSRYSTTIKRRGCTAETREKLLEDLKAWVRDPNEAKVYWMNGMAGTGKTTIGYTLCEWLAQNRLLGGNYFCSRISPTCRNVNNIVSTLAYQFAQYSPAFRWAVCKVLDEEPHASKLDIRWQFQKLIQGPTQEVKSAVPENVVVVVDALDECDDNDAVRLFLETMLKLAADLPIKIFITSRPEPLIRDKMLASQYSQSVLHLHDIEESIVEEDIKKYLKDALDPMAPPPSSSDIERLANCAGKLFIYAATAIRYIHPGDSRVNSNARLRTMLGLTSGSTKQNDELNGLYSSILSAALDSKHLEDEELDNIRLMLKTVICAKEPITIQTLASLHGLAEEDVSISLQPLRSVLHIQEGVRGFVSPFHASFPDYLLDKFRSEEFYCDKVQHSEILAGGCFTVMHARLRFNICNLELSFVFDQDVPDLERRIKECISSDLSYSCRYWGEHLLDAELTGTLHGQLVNFLTRQLLFWMEVLNLQRQMVMGAEILRQARKCLKELFSDTRKLLTDAEAFVTRFTGGACSRSTPHIYISGLPFCRKSSSVYKNYWGRTKGLIDVRGSLVDQWQSAATGVWTTHSFVKSVAFSPDGTRVVSGCLDGTIQIWDARSGEIIAGPFEGHLNSVNSVAFSADGTRIASGSSDCSIRVWDTRTGDTVAGPLKGHMNSVTSVVFSQDGTRIVSGSRDRTIRLWNAYTGKDIAGPFEGHRYSVNSVAFSHDGVRIASGSSDRTITVWDALSGNVIAGPFEGHRSSVNTVGFSPDGNQIISGSDDCTIRMWNAHTGLSVAGPFKGHKYSVTSVAFSQDGTRIISGSADQTIRVWNPSTGSIIAEPFEGHTDWVNSVAFSKDGTFIVSGSSDGTIRIWDAQTGNATSESSEGIAFRIQAVAFTQDGTRIVSISESRDRRVQVWHARTGNVTLGTFEEHRHLFKSLSLSNARTSAVGNARTSEAGSRPFDGHLDWVNSVAFSADSTRIVSGSSDCTVRVWDAWTGNAIAGPLQGHTHSINSVAFSQDGNYIVSGSVDRMIRVWDAYNGEVIAGPFEGHTDVVKSVAFSQDGAYLVSGSEDCTIRLWHARTGDTVVGPFQGHEDSVNSVAFSVDGTRIVSGSRDHTVRVWNASTGDTIAGPFHGHTDYVHSVVFSSDGTLIASGSADSTIRVWNAYTGDSVAGPFEGHTDSIYSVAFSQDSTRIASGSRDQTVRVWDAHTGNVVAGPFKGHRHLVKSVAFSPDDTQVVSGSADCTIRVWDVQHDKVIVGPSEGHADSANSVVERTFSQDGSVFASTSRDRVFQIWDARTGNAVAGPFEGHSEWVISVAFSWDGTRVVSGSIDSTVRIWDAHTGDTIAGPCTGHTNSVISLSFSQDDALIVSGCSDCTIRVWDAHTGNGVAGPFLGHTAPVNSVSFSPDGTRIVSSSFDGTIRVWDAWSSDIITEYFTRDSTNAFVSSHPIQEKSMSKSSLIFNEDGWITKVHLPFFWIPHSFRPRLPYPPHNTLVIGPEGSAFTDYSDLTIGEFWSHSFFN